MAKDKKTNVPEVKVLNATKVIEHEIFKIIEINGKCMIAVTNQIVSKQQFKSVEEAKAYIDSKPWELILNSVAVMDAILAKTSK